MNTLSTPDELYAFIASSGGIFACYVSRPEHGLMEELEKQGKVRRGFETERKVTWFALDKDGADLFPQEYQSSLLAEERRRKMLKGGDQDPT